MTPVMSMLYAAQTDIMTSSTGNLTGKEAFKRFDKAPDVSRMGMLTNDLDDIGASMRVLEDVTTMVEYCAAYGMGRRSAICSSPARLPKNSENCGKHRTEWHQPALLA